MKFEENVQPPPPEYKVPDISKVNGVRTQEEIYAFYTHWEDPELTTHMWNIILSGTVDNLESFLELSPIMGFMQSSDSRGSMWWPFEIQKQDMVLMGNSLRSPGNMPL